MTDLQGYTALVTGASAGIGEAIARRLAADGARLLVHGRDEQRTRRVAEALDAELIVADLAEASGLDAVLAAIEAVGTLDVLVNNAGFEEPATVDQLDPRILERMFRINVFAPVELIRRSLPQLQRSGRGSIINVTSIHESVPVAGNSGYATTKAALAAYTRTAAVELGPRGIRINNLAPGAIRTAMNEHLIDEIGAERFGRWIPAGRVGAVDDVAGAASFLAGPDSRYISGTTVTVDGAYSNHLVRYEPDPG
ncbi:SDR family NAD(P)-dependent oxidoreductase [Microbacterium sp. A8/3-1]|uniref:SDR family NAD(P)-dependent oxidoreductase n=1 Tax=Microbacterium sp. A8/3-1 TaxID=3160749 RepID=A0AAU7VT10_9MICO